MQRLDLFHKKITLFSCSLLVVCNAIIAQTSNPLSRYGFGNVYEPQLTATQGMGGIAAGYRNELNINYLNPASYSGASLTTFEAAAYLQSNTFSLGDSSYSSNNGSASHLCIQMPLKRNKAGLAFGVFQNSGMNYGFSSTVSTDSTKPTNYFTGKGSTYRAFVGSGIKFGNFSIGLNAGFIFGNIAKSTISDFVDSLGYYDIQHEYKTSTHDFVYDLGVQYRKRFKNDGVLTLGVVGSSNVWMDQTKSEFWRNGYFLTNTFYQKDTAYVSDGTYTKTLLPGYVRVGATYNYASHITLGADIIYKNSSAYKSATENDVFRNNLTLVIGGEYRPATEDAMRNAKFLKRTSYRFGANVGNSEYVYKDEQLKKYGVSAGLGIPLRGKRIISSCNIAVSYQENYTKKYNLADRTVRATVGFTISDRWFVRPKFD